MDIENYVMEHLKCVICNEYEADLMQCYNGHSHCKACFKRYEQSSRKKELRCSICMCKGGWCTNRQMFQLACDSKLTIACNIEGCDKKIDLRNLSEHRRTCKHKLFNCPLNCLECKPVTFVNLYNHVCTHNKVIDCTTNGLQLMMSEMVNYGPRVILYKKHVLQLNCFLIYERRCETRLVVKCCVIGYESPKSEITMNVWQWNMLNNNYVHSSTNLIQVEDFVPNEFTETLVLTGMKNYVSETMDTCVIVEKLTKSPQEKPNASGVKIHEMDYNEDVQELHTITIAFVDGDIRC